MSDTGNPSWFGAVMRDVRLTLSDVFRARRLSEDEAATLASTFGMLGLLARADRIVTTHEAEFVNTLMDRLELPRQGLQLAMEAFEKGRKGTLDLEQEAFRFLSVHEKGSLEVSRLFDALLRLAAADGRFHPRERAFLEQLGTTLGLDTRDLDQQLAALLARL